ncbi:MAG: cobalamin biosynthesis protein CobW [Pseudomonadota bacterium]
MSATPGASLAKVPCSIVTGFLGAGKTTLIRHLLENANGRRLAVIVNEFGDVGIDGEILKGCGIESCTEDAIVELANGCLCCTVADDFVPALNGILNVENPPEHIIIETSGLALPKPLVQAFNWPEIASKVTVDGVITVVDGAAVAAGRFADDLDALAKQKAEDETLDHDNPLEEVYEDQLLCADLVILHKADLLPDADRARVADEISKTIPRTVKVVEAQHGQVPQHVLLGLEAASESDIAGRHAHHHHHDDHDHDDFDTFVLDMAQILEPADLVARIEMAASAHDILRIKGFVDVAGKPMRMIVQGVGSRIATQFDRPWATNENRQGRLVVIGQHGLDIDAVRAALAG